MAKPAKPKTAKIPKPKTVKAPKAERTTRTSKVHNLVDPKIKALFVKDLEDYEKLRAAMVKAQTNLRKFGKVVKEDGFTMRQIKLAFDLKSPEGEAIFKSQVANDLLAAQYIGADIGEQLSLFLDPVRVPATDRAAKEGQTDAMANKPAKPSYDPATDQYNSYMNAYHEEQARQVTAGIKPLDDGKTTLIKKDAKAAAAPKDEAPPRPPQKASNVTPLTHKAQSAAQKAAAANAKETAEKYFKPMTSTDKGDFH